MLACPPDRCYDRNTPWETSQWQGIIQGIPNFPSLEAGTCKALPPGRHKAERKASTSETKLKVLHGPSPNQPWAASEKPDHALPLFPGRRHIPSQLENPAGKLETPGAEAGEHNDA